MLVFSYFYLSTAKILYLNNNMKSFSGQLFTTKSKGEIGVDPYPKKANIF